MLNRLYLGIGFNRIAYYSLHVHLFKGNMMHVGQWVECILQFVHLWTGRWGWRFLRYQSIQGCQIVYFKRLSSPHYLSLLFIGCDLRDCLLGPLPGLSMECVRRLHCNQTFLAFLFSCIKILVQCLIIKETFHPKIIICGKLHFHILYWPLGFIFSKNVCRSQSPEFGETLETAR